MLCISVNFFLDFYKKNCCMFVVIHDILQEVDIGINKLGV